MKTKFYEYVLERVMEVTGKQWYNAIGSKEFEKIMKKYFKVKSLEEVEETEFVEWYESYLTEI